jgi:hypothetical protein
MRIRTFSAAFVVAAVATLPLAGIAAADVNLTCDAFSSQSAAQAALADNPSLDDDGDGKACESSKSKSDDSDKDDDKDKDKKKDKDKDKSDDKDKKKDDDSDSDKSDDKQVKKTPKGSDDTGDGSSTTDPAPAALTLAGMVALGIGAAARRGVRQSN